ncbi:hypothetical protein HDU86_001637 [Geranomyces michiganensis]|nr:hypothetical protein HDU86_001637 [Geranomyces michiganensis]
MAHRNGRLRYFENDGVVSDKPFDVNAECGKQLTHLVATYPPQPETFLGLEDDDLLGLYSGPTSIAFGLFLLAPRWPAPVAGKRLLDWAKAYLDTAKKVAAVSKAELFQEPIDSRNCGIVHEIATRLTLQAVMEEDDAAVEQLLSHVPAVCADSEKGAHDEWCFGRAGFLYLLRAIAHYRPAFRETITAAQGKVIDAILRRGPGTDLGPWRFHDRTYLGVGHGWIGIIAQVLLTDPSAGRAAQVRPWLALCIDEQQPDGSWKCLFDDAESAGSEAQAREIVSAGHGAPSMLLGLLAVRDIYAKAGDDELVRKIDEAVAAAQDHIWAKGLLTKESCLLHGAAGNSLVVLDRARKAKFLEYSVQERLDAGVKDGSIEASEPRSGLYKGIVGRCWAMLEYLDGRNGVFPSFNEV